MPVLVETAERFAVERPFEGMSIGFRLHLEPKTAVLIEALRAGGASITAVGNAGTTQFGTVEVLRDSGCVILDQPGDGPEEWQAHVAAIAATQPDLVLDNGAELIVASLGNVKPPIGATEETTSGAFLLREEHPGQVPFPVIVINDSPLKSIVENKHGVGESVIDTIVRSTNISMHKKRTVVFGYGWCGRGIAEYARRRGADVTVVEPDPVKALEAAMDGFDIRIAETACAGAEVVITATGRPGVVRQALLGSMADGVLLANAGHVDTEIDVVALDGMAEPVEVSASLQRFDLSDGRSLFLLARGRIVNLAAEGGLGNPIEAMDLGLTLQALSLEAHAKGLELPNGPIPVPDSINEAVSRGMLEAMGQGF